MNTKGPECWGSDSNARALRIDLSAQQAFLLPFDQLVYAEYGQEAGEQRLRAVFGTHEVLIRGQALRRVVTALQRLELAFVTPLSSSARLSVPEGQPVITLITVTEVKRPEAPLTDHENP